ncbi:MAG TPA: primosomal protein N' [Candidatus Saccharibacteria bacterium]|nr:primosomal protein N' [Candidatus Saccharibacteria bacterium]
MHYYEVAPQQIVRANKSSFTYSHTSALQTGQLVRIEVGTKQLTGIVLGASSKPEYVVKPITNILHDEALPQPLLKLIEWLSQYYASALPLVLQAALPHGLEKKRRAVQKQTHKSRRKRTSFVLNKDQAAAVESIITDVSGTSLLHGVTGSGKTAVYIELAKRVMKEGKSCIVLVPEIALTSQLIDEFSQHFEDILLTHSKQTEAMRHTTWLEALQSMKPRIAIGPRSALFLPLQNVGLIIIDEAHEPSYKQEQTPRYSALRAAHTLASAHKAKLVLGSATPLVADYYTAVHMSRPIVSLPTPAVPTHPPSVRLVDMTKRSHFRRHRFLSDDLLTQLDADFEAGKQVLIFHNRRGSASVTLCENCGWQAGCPRCYIPLTLHTDSHRLQCHICGYKASVPTSCPECHHVDIVHRGIGTKLIESELSKLYPNISIARFDGDTSPENSVENRYKELYEGTIQCIIGTQVIAKGLDLPKLHTVGVVQADASLSLPDFSSPERTFQLLAQVVGRVGRAAHETNVIVQSYQPTHPIVQAGMKQDYETFYHIALEQLRRGKFPPYSYLLKLTCVYKTEKAAIANARKLAGELKRLLPADVEILGPTPAFYERVRDTYRWQLVLKSPKRAHLEQAIQHVPSQGWQFELDPLSLL